MMRKISRKGLFNRITTGYSIWIYIGAFSLFVLFACVSNWSLLLGENLMKYDIWDAEYPAQVLMSDTLASKTIPIWNPLMRYGAPYYSFLGTPIWYPITLVLALIGYTPSTIAVCYVFHIAIGGFGMFLLAKQEIAAQTSFTLETFFACLLTGFLYCGCGVFLSNAQHIMIIISAAWIPYVFFFVRFYLKTKKIIFGMAAGICAGMILLGGYPEIFFSLFLFLFPYTLYYYYNRKKTVVTNIVLAAGKYIVVCISTILSSAIVLLPFLVNRGLITRGNGFGVVPSSYPMSTILSMFFSNMSQILENAERSMVDYYMGLIVILLVPYIIMSNRKNKKLYILLSGSALLLCPGRESFLHSILYRFAPMYDSFRFPTLNRIFLILFMQLLFAPAICQLLKMEIKSKSIFLGKILFCISLTLAVIAAFAGNFGTENVLFDRNKCLLMEKSAFITAGITGIYIFIFYEVKNKRLQGKELCIILTGAVCVEALTFAYEEAPYSITQYGATEYGYDQRVQDKISHEFEANRKRERSTNFANHKRSTSGLNSKDIVFKKTFDEEGYQSFLLKRTSDFSNTYLRSIMEQNPEIYFTNNVVSKGEISYEEWVNACDTPPEQIYVEDSLGKREVAVQQFLPEILQEEELKMTEEEDGVIVEGNIDATSSATGHIRIYWGTVVESSKTLYLTFTDSDGNQQKYQGEFLIKNEESRTYVDIYLPDVKKKYKSVKIETNRGMPVSAKLVVTDRMANDQYVNVSDFGFNSIGMTVEAPTEGYVTVLQAMHAGWVAYVDGEKAEIDMVDEAFMGIHVGKGTHTIVMRFRPKDFLVGIVITGTYWIAFLTIFFLSLYKKYRHLKNT